MTETSRDKMRQSFVEMIEKQNNKYHLTITFKDNTSDKLALTSFDLLLDRINREVFTRRYFKKTDQHLTGFVARERNINGTYHFHSLLSDPYQNLPNMDQIRTAIDKVRPSIKSVSGRELIGRHSWLLQSYFNDGNSALENYITKNLLDRRLCYQEAFDSIGLITKKGACFGSS